MPVERGWCAADIVDLDEATGERNSMRAVIPRNWIDLIARAGVDAAALDVLDRRALARVRAVRSADVFSFDWDLFCRFLLKTAAPSVARSALSVARPARRHEDHARRRSDASGR